MRRPGTPGPRGGGVFVTELQRTRLLDATFAVVSEDGYKQMTVRRVSGRAGVSNKTFYDLFENREDCFLAAFDEAVERLAAVVVPAYKGEKEWAERVRAGLGALLGFLDHEPALRSLVFIEALGAGPRVLARRARVLEDLASVIDEGRAGVKAGRELPPLTAESIVGAAFSVIHARLLEHQPGSLTALLNPLMATIVLPYRGHAAATRELKYPVSKAGARTLSEGLDLLPPDESRGSAGRTSGSRAGSRQSSGSHAGPGERLDPARFRPTQRTQMVLAAVAELGERGSGPSNRQVADAAQVMDQGQISKLLARLEGVGLITNTGGHTQGVPNAWHLTPHGEEILRAGTSRDRPGSSPYVGRTPQ
jgi:AcrR family transcriptional regulator